MSILIPPERICSDCGSNTTTGTQWYNSKLRRDPNKPTKYKQWYKKDTGFICKKCYELRRQNFVKSPQKRVYQVCAWCSGNFRKRSGNLKFCSRICQRKFNILGK